MDTLTHEEIKELQEHQAIPYGGWKLAVGVTAHLWCILCAWALSRYASTQLEQVMTVSWAHLNGGGIFTIAIGLMNGALFLLQRAWLTQFWRRNVRSYVARFYRSSSSERPLQRTITTPRENQNLARTMIGVDVGTGAFAIGLLLNGRLAQIMSTNRNAISRLEGWSVRLRAILDTGAVMVEIRKRNNFWGIDERIVTDIGNALAWLEEIATQPCAPITISDLVRWKTTQFNHAFREREALERQKTALFGILMDAAGNPADSISNIGEWMEQRVRQLIARINDLGAAYDRLYAKSERTSHDLTEITADLAHERAAAKDLRKLLEQAEARHDLLQNLLDNTAHERSAAVAEVKRIAEAFAESTRLHETIEALRVYIDILTWLLTLDREIVTAEEKERYAAARANAHTILADKELARRRHRRSRATTAS